MKKIEIENLYKLSYQAKVINAIKQKWNNGDTYNFLGNKKKQHLFSYFLNCSAVYTLKNGETLRAAHNSIIYTPEGSEYKVDFVDCDASSEYNSIAINFKLFDQCDIPFCLGDCVKIYSLNQSSQVFKNFHDIANSYQFAVNSPMKITGLFYILLSDMSYYYHTKKNILPRYSIIAKGINTIENQCINDIKINELAKLCNVSPVYFRMLFKEYSGTTPINYKLNAIISQAKQYLIFSNKSVTEISDILNFSSPTYFCRIFKKKTGQTPVQYIKSESSKK